jgi:hypothetical protein
MLLGSADFLNCSEKSMIVRMADAVVVGLA